MCWKMPESRWHFLKSRLAADSRRSTRGCGPRHGIWRTTPSGRLRELPSRSCPSGSCSAMIRHGYLELFADDAVWLPRAQALAARSFEFCEYLVDELGITNVGASWTGKLAYHPSCHLLRGLGVDVQPRALLAELQGAEIVELPHAEECCGFGGVFSVEHADISAAMLERKIEQIERSEATTIVTADTGCLLQINGGLNRMGLPRRVLHIAEVLQNIE